MEQLILTVNRAIEKKSYDFKINKYGMQIHVKGKPAMKIWYSASLPEEEGISIARADSVNEVIEKVRKITYDEILSHLHFGAYVKRFGTAME